MFIIREGIYYSLESIFLACKHPTIEDCHDILAVNVDGVVIGLEPMPHRNPLATVFSYLLATSVANLTAIGQTIQLSATVFDKINAQIPDAESFRHG